MSSTAAARSLAVRIAEPAFVLVQVEPTLRVLAVADHAEPLADAVRTLMAMQAERGDDTLFAWVIQATPKLAG